MIGTPRPATVFTKQQRIAELARNGPEMAFTTLAHHIDINWMHMAYAETRKDGAVGVDGQTADDYQGHRTTKPNMDRMKRLDLRKNRRFWTIHSQYFDCFVVNTAL